MFRRPSWVLLYLLLRRDSHWTLAGLENKSTCREISKSLRLKEKKKNFLKKYWTCSRILYSVPLNSRSKRLSADHFSLELFQFNLLGWKLSYLSKFVIFWHVRDFEKVLKINQISMERKKKAQEVLPKFFSLISQKKKKRRNFILSFVTCSIFPQFHFMIFLCSSRLRKWSSKNWQKLLN